MATPDTTIESGLPTLRERLDKRWYPHLTSNWDDSLLRSVVLSHISPTSVVLDLGAGAGIVPQMNFKGLGARVCGVDLDPRVVSNPFLDEGRVANGAEIPYPDNHFDLVFADNLLEHLTEPEAVFKEVFRVLKSGGVFIAKTPNRFHYVPLLAQLTPLWFHKFFNKLRGRESEDTFPTVYRANSEKAVRGLARSVGFRVEDIRLVEGRPEYLRFNPLTYFAGMVYERIVNSTHLLRHLRVVLLPVLRKP